MNPIEQDQIDRLSTSASREPFLLALYATHSANSQGRKHPEPEHAYRSPYQRDRDRIVHSSAFRRLAHKTQVFTGNLGDYHRTRLTHTLEVASIARTMARALRLNEDLVEALALAHDIGHPPFGHAGEQTLHECTLEQGGFNHNRQALRIFEHLETSYPDFPGLNLTNEVLAGQQHRAEGKKSTSGSMPSLEVQVVDASDNIAYNAHDADDALQMGLLQAEELDEVPLWRAVASDVTQRFGTLDEDQFRRAVVRQLINRQATAHFLATKQRIADQQIESLDDVRDAALLVKPEEDAAKKQKELESFLFARVYRHSRVLEQRDIAQNALRSMFQVLCDNPEKLPGKPRELAQHDDLERAVADYLAGMTDRFAWDEHARLIKSS